MARTINDAVLAAAERYLDGVSPTGYEAANVYSNYEIQGVAATSWAVLVDLSDSTNYPHEAGSSLNISLIDMEVDRATNSVGQMDLGIVTRVDGTNGDVTLINSVEFTAGDEAYITHSTNFSPSVVRCAVVAGATPYIAYNTKVLNNTGIQSDVALASFQGAGTVTPAVGDLVVRFLHTSGAAWNGSVEIMYQAV